MHQGSVRRVGTKYFLKHHLLAQSLGVTQRFRWKHVLALKPEHAHVPRPSYCCSTIAYSRRETSPAGGYLFVSFYALHRLSNLESLRSEIYSTWKDVCSLGRLYLSSEGINGQVVVKTQHVPALRKAILESIPTLSDETLVFNYEPEEVEENVAREAFPGFRIRLKQCVVSNGDNNDGELDWSQNGVDLSPEEWHNSISDADIVLDVRNWYETEIGRFESAVPLQSDVFRDQYDEVASTLETLPKSANVYMYCTGGIRCEKMGAYVTQKLGYENVSKLAGGILAYTAFVDRSGVESKFKGKNFVFDNRLGVRVTDDVLSSCHQCGAPSDHHVNCAHPPCHLLFIQCEACGTHRSKTCSIECEVAIRDPLADLSESWGFSKGFRRHLDGPRRPVPRTHERFKGGPFVDFRRRYSALTNPESDKWTNICSYSEGHTHPHSGLLQSASILQLLLRPLHRPNVVELGAFTGYSALAMAEIAALTGGRITTCERDPKAAAVALENINNSAFGDFISLVEGDALSLLSQQEARSVDFVFIDADKARYQLYYDFVLDNDLLSERGLIVVDNVLWKTQVVEVDKDKRSQRMDDFNKYVTADQRTQSTFLPVRDGLTVISKVP